MGAISPQLLEEEQLARRVYRVHLSCRLPLYLGKTEVRLVLWGPCWSAPFFVLALPALTLRLDLLFLIMMFHLPRHPKGDVSLREVVVGTLCCLPLVCDVSFLLRIVVYSSVALSFTLGGGGLERGVMSAWKRTKVR